MGAIEDRLYARARAHAPAAVCMLAMAIAVVLLAAPSRALAAVVDHFTVGQEFSKTGMVPEGLGSTFTYQLTRVAGKDGAAPLPTNAEGDAYTFTLDGDTSKDVALAPGDTATADALTFPHAGVFSYRLRCVTDPSGTEGLAVDDTVYDVEIEVNNTNDGLAVSHVVIRRESDGYKPDAASFSHSFEGQPEPAPEPEKPVEILGVKLPVAGDATWGLIQLSAAICVGGAVLIAAAIRRKKREREARP